MSSGLPLGQRKSVDICAFLFQTLQLESKRLTAGEKLIFQRVLTEKYAVPTDLATTLIEFLRRH